LRENFFVERRWIAPCMHTWIGLFSGFVRVFPPHSCCHNRNLNLFPLTRSLPPLPFLLPSFPPLLHRPPPGEYACFQIDAGAQVIQVFDSWAGHLSPADYDIFAAPYQRQVIEKIKAKHPTVPIIIYINKSGALLERMAQSGADMVSLDWTVTMEEGRRRLGSEMGVQGNLDPAILYAPKEVIKERAEQILREGKGFKHVMNLGHGIEATTPEENAKFFIDTVKAWRY